MELDVVNLIVTPSYVVPLKLVGLNRNNPGKDLVEYYKNLSNQDRTIRKIHSFMRNETKTTRNVELVLE